MTIDRSRGLGLKLCCPSCGEERELVLNLDLLDCACDTCGDSWFPDVAASIFRRRAAAWDAFTSWVEEAKAPSEDPAEVPSEVPAEAMANGRPLA